MSRSSPPPSTAARRWYIADPAGTRRFYRSPRAARQNLSEFMAGWPYGPEDLRSDTAPRLLAVTRSRERGSRISSRPSPVAELPFDDWYWA